MSTNGRLIVVTGVMASGKSSVAQALAERFDPSIHVRGDAFRRWVVRGGIEPVPPTTDVLLHQLRLRNRAAIRAAEVYADAGFTAVLQDVIFGPLLADAIAAIRVGPAHLVVLDPGPEAVTLRESRRNKTAYGAGWAPAAMVAELRDTTPRIGLWLDTSALSVDETADAILDRLAESRVDAEQDERRA